MRRNRMGFTIIELLTVVSIILLLIAILLPALNRARRQAKDVNARAHLHAIETALELFQNERGQYPSSDTNDQVYSDADAEAARLDEGWFNSGMHLLAEALVGRDQMGFDPTGVYDAIETGNRVGPLLKLGSAGALVDNDPNINGLKPWGEGSEYATGALMLVDPSYGLPVLYYRASPTGQTSIELPDAEPPTRGYFRFEDNGMVTGDINEGDVRGWNLEEASFAEHARHAINDGAPGGSFEEYITNPRIGDPNVAPRPYNMESFLLLSPGYDKLYGTTDDIRNWTIPE